MTRCVREWRVREFLASLRDKTGNIERNQNLKSCECHDEEFFSQWKAIQSFVLFFYREITSYLYFRIWILPGEQVWRRNQPGSSCSTSDEISSENNEQGGSFWSVLEVEVITFWSLLDGRDRRRYKDSEVFNPSYMANSDAIIWDRGFRMPGGWYDNAER